MRTLQKVFEYFKKNPEQAIIILIGSACILMTTVFDGIYGCTKQGCGFILGSNFNDVTWFLAISNVSFNTWPFQMPTFAGGELRAYHILPNLIVHILSFTGISGIYWFYQILPIVYVILLPILVVRFGKIYKNSRLFTTFLLFFLYFGTHLSYLFSLIRKHYIDNTWGMTPLFQASRAWESPHFSFSILIFFATLALLLQKKNKSLIQWTIVLLLFLEVGTKMYAGILLTFTLVVYEFMKMIKLRSFQNSITRMVLYSAAFLLGVLVFFNPLSGKGSVFVFSPFSIVHHMIEEPVLFHLPSLVNARYFLATRGYSPRLFMIEGISTFLFIVYYFGIRTLGLGYWVYKVLMRKASQLEIVLGCTALLSILISIMVIQQGAWYNTVQFAPYGAFICSIFTAELFVEIWQRKKLWSYALVTILILFTMPAALSQLNYLNSTARIVIPKEEMDALSYLQHVPAGVVFAPVDYYDTSYVAAFGHQQTYVNGIQQINNSSYDFQSRFDMVTNFKKLNVQDLDVKYVYIPRTLKDRSILLKKIEKSNLYYQIYENKGVYIYEKKASE